MAYFNYFIKCIIRNIAYKLCKPKVFLTVLLSIAILFGLKHFGYCVDGAWTEADVDFCNSMLNSISNNTDYLYSINSTLANGTNVKLEEIKQKLDSNNANLTEIKQELIELNNTVTNILSELTGETISFSFPLQGLLYCESIPDLDYGNNVQNFQIVNGNVNCGIYKINYSFRAGTTYTFSFDGSSDGTQYSRVYYTFDNAVIGSTISAYYVGQFTANDLNFSITPDKDCTITLLVRNPAALTSSLGNWVITGVRQGLINELQETMDKNNQLQQEQNNILKDDNVVVDASTLPSDTTTDITGDGFDNIFQQLYTTFTSGSAQDVIITIPFTNKSFTINSSTVYGNANLGFIKTLIEAFWYFIISYFIVRDIGKKINKIKSGDIEHVQEDNIKEDLL